MIIVIIICSILYILMISLLYYLYVEYKRDYKEVEESLLQLEKRIEDFKKDYKGIYIPINDEMSLLIPLCEKDKIDMEKINYYFSNYGKPSVKVKEENNTQEGCECEMPCGRKKGRGGRRK